MQPERSFAAHPPRVPRRRLFGVRSRRGQSLVEMALILPILLLLVGGIIQFGMLFWTQNTLTQIARDTGRWAATQTACGPAEVSAIQNQADAIAAQSSLLGYRAGAFGPNVTPTWSGSPCPPADNSTVSWVTVQVQHSVASFIPFLNYAVPWCNGSTCTLTTSAQFRMEPKPSP